jgi:hypothetical protein
MKLAKSKPVSAKSNLILIFLQNPELAVLSVSEMVFKRETSEY